MKYWFHPRCGTCKKAASLLKELGITPEAYDLTLAPIPASTLKDMMQRAGLSERKWFNTSGQSYRDGGFGARVAGMTRDEVITALAADGMLVKRPVLDTGAVVLVGLNEAEWRATLGAGSSGGHA
jgi:arsenate reductase